MASHSYKIFEIQRPQARVVSHPAALRFMARERQSAQILSIPMTNGIRRVRIESIVCCASDGNYCRITLTDSEELYFAKTLKWVAQRLPDSQFIRVHASHLVNVKHVHLVKPDRILLANGMSVPVSRSRRGEVRDKVR